MIQRVQSLYLLLAAAVSAVLFFIPLFELPAASANALPKIFLTTSNSFLFLLNAAIGIFSVVVIFLFKKRALQIKGCRIIFLMVLVIIALVFYTSDTIANGLDQKVIFKIGSYLPWVQFVFVFLAHRAIKKDDELVRSADRLR